MVSLLDETNQEGNFRWVIKPRIMSCISSSAGPVEPQIKSADQIPGLMLGLITNRALSVWLVLYLINLDIHLERRLLLKCTGYQGEIVLPETLY